jgi:hypothetical protein
VYRAAMIGRMSDLALDDQRRRIGPWRNDR